MVTISRRAAGFIRTWQSMLALMQSPLKVSSRRTKSFRRKKLNSAMSNLVTSDGSIIHSLECCAAIGIPNFTKAMQTTAHNQTLVNEAQIACALERYQLAHGEYPETLDALVPQFMRKIAARHHRRPAVALSPRGATENFCSIPSAGMKRMTAGKLFSAKTGQLTTKMATGSGSIR